MRRHFQTEQWFPFPGPLVFSFFADPRNLPPLMPTWQQARIDEVTLRSAPPRANEQSGASEVVAGSGSTLLITARVAPGLPLRLPWLARIEDFHWDDHFCDVQLQGPFRYWRHCHSVREGIKSGEAGTVVRDEVEYELPLAPLSDLGASLGDLAMGALFRYRQKQAAILLPKFVEQRKPV